MFQIAVAIPCVQRAIQGHCIMDKLMLDHLATFPYFQDSDYVTACKENEGFRALLADMVGDLRGAELPPILLSILCGPSRHKRFTPEQVAVLQAEFDADDSLRARGRADLIAARAGLSKKQVTSTNCVCVCVLIAAFDSCSCLQQLQVGFSGNAKNSATTWCG